MRAIAWLAFYLCLCLNAQAADKVRTWTNLQGRTMQAQFVRELDGDVTFLKDGKLITVPLDQLSEADRQLVRDLESGKRIDDEPPAAGPAAPLPPSATPSGLEPSAENRAPALTKKKAAATDRVWTFGQGNQTTARFVRFHDNKVVMMRGQRTVMIAFDELSKGDQDYVRELLVSRGEASLLPPAPTTTEENAPAATPDPAEAPTPPPAPSAPQPLPDLNPGPSARPGSAIFDELRQRQEQVRQQQAQQIAEMRQRMAAQLPRGGSRSPTSPRDMAASLRQSSGAAEASPGGPRGVIDPTAAREVWSTIVIVVVTVGLLGTVGMIVFIAISIAAMSNRGKRKYS